MLVAYSLSNTSSSCINRSQDERGVKCATLMPWIGVKITAVAIYFITLFKHFIFLVCLFMSTMRASVGAGVNCLPIKVVWCIQAAPPDADNNVEHKFEPPKVLRRSNRPTHVFPSLSKSFFFSLCRKKYWNWCRAIWKECRWEAEKHVALSPFSWMKIARASSTKFEDFTLAKMERYEAIGADDSDYEVELLKSNKPVRNDIDLP